MNPITQQTTVTTVQELPGKYPHTIALDLDGSGMLTEVFVMNRDAIGSIWFFSLTALDVVDRRRLRTILTNKNASMFKSGWELLSQITLGNGQNALIYFNQLVKVKTPSGQVLPFNDGRIGAPIYQGSIDSQTVVSTSNHQGDETITTASQSRSRTTGGAANPK